MIFDEYFNDAYTVKEISLKQVQSVLDDRPEEDDEAVEMIKQFLNGCYSYRSHGESNRGSDKS